MGNTVTDSVYLVERCDKSLIKCKVDNAGGDHGQHTSERFHHC